MRAKITKQIETTTITVAKMVVKEGMATVENLAPFSELGKVNEKHALKFAKERYGEGSYAVVKLESATKAYEMDLEKFIENATEISLEQAKKNNR